jgi:hypothetical protein
MTPARADLFVGMAQIKLHERNCAAALPLLESADRFWRDFDPGSRWAGDAALWLGRCNTALDRRSEARDALGRAERILAGSPIPGDMKLLQLAREG